MKKIVLLSLIIGLLFYSYDTFAKVSLNGQFKPRFEYRDGYRKLTNDSLNPAAFVSQRTRFILDYSNSNLTSRVSLQDVRVWGDEAQMRNTPSIALHEAWVDIYLETNFSLKLGRQELVYEDHRLLGNVDWAQQGRSHDAIIGKYETNDMKLHFGGAFNQTAQGLFGTNYPLQNYKGLGLIWFENKIDSNMKFTLMAVTDAFQENDSVNNNYYRHTLGGNYYYSSQSIDLQGTGFYQLGKTVSDIDISAYMFSVQGFYKFDGFKIGAGIDYISGNDTKGNKYGAFNTLYGTNHKFYGLMDHFLNIPAETNNGGLVDIYAKLKYDFVPKWNASLDFHTFSLEKEIVNPVDSELAEKGLASEIDLVISHTMSKNIKFQLGYSYMIPTEALKIVQGRLEGTNSQWLWAMISVKPEFFTSE